MLGSCKLGWVWGQNEANFSSEDPTSQAWHTLKRAQRVGERPRTNQARQWGGWHTSTWPAGPAVHGLNQHAEKLKKWSRVWN